MKLIDENIRDICESMKMIDSLLYQYIDKRTDILDDLCVYMNKWDINPILELGFDNAYFYIEEYECIPSLVLCFGEHKKRRDFKSDDDWLNYQSENIIRCLDYFDITYPDLDILCVPITEEV